MGPTVPNAFDTGAWLDEMRGILRAFGYVRLTEEKPPRPPPTLRFRPDPFERRRLTPLETAQLIYEVVDKLAPLARRYGVDDHALTLAKAEAERWLGE